MSGRGGGRGNELGPDLSGLAHCRYC